MTNTFASDIILNTREEMIDFFKLVSGDLMQSYISMAFIMLFIGMILGVLYKIIINKG